MPQVLLCAREHVARYYDGWLDADDELAQAAHDAANNNANHHAGALAAAAAASTPLPSRAAAAGGAGATPGGATPGARRTNRGRDSRLSVIKRAGVQRL